MYTNNKNERRRNCEKGIHKPFSKSYTANSRGSDNISSDYDEEQVFDGSYIIGRNPVIEALKAEKLIDTVFVNPDAGGSISLICRMAKEQGIVVKQVNETKLNNMAKGV